MISEKKDETQMSKGDEKWSYFTLDRIFGVFRPILWQYISFKYVNADMIQINNWKKWFSSLLDILRTYVNPFAWIGIIFLKF